MTHLEFPTLADAEKVNKGKYFDKMSKLLNKKVGKKVVIHIIDKASILNGSNNKPFPFFGKVDPKKSKEWADKLKAEASMGICLVEKASDGSLAMQIKIKGCKKQQELADLMSGEGIKVRFVDKLMKDGKELSDDDNDEDDDAPSGKPDAAAKDAEKAVAEVEKLMADFTKMKKSADANNDEKEAGIKKQKEIADKIAALEKMINALP